MGRETRLADPQPTDLQARWQDQAMREAPWRRSMPFVYEAKKLIDDGATQDECADSGS